MSKVYNQYRIFIFLAESSFFLFWSIIFVLATIDLKIITKKFLSLLNLLIAEIFYIYELTNVIIIYQKNNSVFAALQIVLPGIKDFNNS